MKKSLLMLLIILFPFFNNSFAAEKITLQLKWKHQFQFAGYYAALEKGFYKNAGLDVKIVEAQEGITPANEVINGNAQFGVAMSDLISLRAKGSLVVALAVIYQHSPLILLSPKKNKIDNIHDLKGRRIALESHAEELLAYFESEGIPSADMVLLPHEYSVSNLISGEVDGMSAYSTDEPFILKQKGIPYNIFSPRAGGIDFYGDTLFTTQKLIASKPKQVLGFLDASLKGWQYALNNQGEIIDLILSKYTKRHSREHLEFEAKMSEKLIMADVVELGYMNPGRWEHISNIFKKLNKVPANFSLEGFIYDRNPASDHRLLYSVLASITFICLLTFFISARFYKLNKHLRAEIDKRRVLQETLKENEKKVSTLMSNLPGMAYRCSNDEFFTMTFLSQGCKELTGFDVNSLINNKNISFIDLIHPDDRKHVTSVVNDAVLNRSPFKVVYRIISKTNDIKWVWEQGRGIYSRNNQLRHLEGFITDITKQKNIEAALRVSEEKYRSLVEKSEDIIWTIDLNFETRYVNPAIMTHLGFTPKERKEQAIHEQMTPESYTSSLEAIKEEIKKEQQKGVDPNRTMVIETEYYHKNKNKIWFENLVSWLRNQEGEIIGIQGISRNIADRKLAEAKLKESEQFHREFFQNSPTAMYLQDFSWIEDQIRILKDAGTKDLKSYLTQNENMLQKMIASVKIKAVNKAAVNLYKAPKEDALIKSFNNIIVPDDKEHIIDQIVQFANNSDWYEGNARNYDFKGNILEILLRKVPINREENGLSKILVSVVDVTDLKKTHFEKQQLEKKLYQAQKMESIGNLAGGIAHDFNNILSSIIGFSDIALSSVEKGSEIEDDLLEINQAGKRAADLIKQILIFARKSEEKLRPIKIQPIADEALKLLRSTLPSNIKIHGQAESNFTVMGDETQVHQILMNLCTNASQSMEKNGGILSVSIADEILHQESIPLDLDLIPGNYVKIEISDTGTGIPDHAIDSIFEPYFTTKDIGEGTGLGLATVHGIVEKYSGKIAVKSVVKKGTCFTIYLPAKQTQLISSIDSEEEMPIGKESILLVDDEKAITKMNKRFLESLGYKAVETNSSPEALQLFKNNPDQFDLIVTDMTMPVMTGDKLAGKLLEIKPDIPVILCTGYSKILSKKEAGKTGIKAFIEKPIDKILFSRTIRELLEGNKS